MYKFLLKGMACGLFLFVSPYSKAQDKFKAAERESIKGQIGTRLQNAYQNRVLAQDIDALIAPFKDRNETSQWQSEFWGKWFTSAVLAYKYQPTSALRTKLDSAVSKLIATQSDDGYIGNYKPEARLQQWDIWGRKYCLLGLLDYYNLTADQKSLKAARGVADHLMEELKAADGIIVTKGNYRGMATSSILEPVCQLYKATKSKKYLEFAEQIVAQWETPQGPKLISMARTDVAKRFPKPQNWYSYEQGQKAYEMMSCYEGLLELYRLTGKPAYKEAVEQTWKNIYDTEINVAGSGASTEMWFGGRAKQAHPVHHYQETCVTVTWIKLSQQLLRLTGEAKYADAVEQSYYNALLGSMSPDGAEWAKYTPLTGYRLPGSGQCGMNINCCVASGPRGLFNLPEHVVMASPDGIAVNYYVPGEYQIALPWGRPALLTQQTSYPEEGTIRFGLKLQKEETFSIDFRIPSWSAKTSIIVNGDTTKVTTPGQYFALRRNWKSGDSVQLSLDMRGRVVYADDSRQHAALMRGPVLLARDESLPGVGMGSVVDISNPSGYVELEPVPHQEKDGWLQFRYRFVPESYTEAAAQAVTTDFCDYASAGNGAKKGYFITWLPQIIDPRK
ncbi:beta-L-arabinofuranosidase domain-containing protein [Pedobacter sp. JY14-1]|uniref:glycoside hydrolase family 127 protein n=1 Tax=Pedobacter sp. JY14-1 TaxID=3034151 RepID=UPI0023E1CC08|nr:beta-L-arabinofuranosidase domain-containing protein [Pedobacter sp. JY14-1]